MTQRNRFFAPKCVGKVSEISTVSICRCVRDGKLLKKILKIGITSNIPRDDPILIEVPVYGVGFCRKRRLPLRDVGLDIQSIVENYHKVVYYKEDVKVPLDIVDEMVGDDFQHTSRCATCSCMEPLES